MGNWRQATKTKNRKAEPQNFLLHRESEFPSFLVIFFFWVYSFIQVEKIKLKEVSLSHIGTHKYSFLMQRC